MTTILPLQINALYLDKPQQVIGQDIRFENIPWMNTAKNVFENPNTPLETNSIIPRPFSYDNAIYLERGVHIHFVLPEYYKKFDENGNLPHAPNRWYIKNETSGKEWVIESNYIWDINDPILDKHATCTYVEGEAGKDFNFHYVGRKYDFEDWKPKENANKHIKDLTALGWGSMSFDVHYPNCRSVFGFHDVSGKANDNYEIIGWLDKKPQVNIVVGKFSLKNTEVAENKSPITDNFKVAIANTLPEALAALILEGEIDKGAASLTQKLTLEEQFEALLNFDTLNDQKLDLVSRLRHSLHEKQFYQTKGITKWQFKALENHSKIEQILTELYSFHLDLLNTLNEDQKQYDLDSFRFYSLLESLYLDWSNYLRELYIENKDQRNINQDLSSLKAKYETLITFKNQLELEYNQILSQKINIEYSVKSSNNELIEEKACWVLGIEKESAKIEDAVNEVVAALKDIQLERVNDINFEHVLPPSVVIASSKEIKDKQNLQKQDPINFEIKFDFTGDNISEEFQSFFIQYPQLKQDVILNEKNYYKVQWHAQFLPKKVGYYLENQSNEFKSNFINDSYQLDEQNADLIKQDDHAAISYSNNENNYYGESFIDSTIQDYLLNKIEASLSSEEAAIKSLHGKLKEYKEKLNNLNVVTISLSDFNNLMTQRSTALSVLPLIPNGFQNHQNLANDLSLLFTQHKENVSLFTPNRLSTFNPLRNGAMRIARLRTIDSFGRVQFLQPKTVLTTKQQTIKGKADWINLPPRLMQPAALNIDIVKTKTKEIDNPVIGYLLPSYLNQHLQFFDAFGAYLGSINEEGKWEPSPFDVFLAIEGGKSYKSCKNKDLINAIDWFLIHSGNASFRSRIIQEIQTNLEHVQPENYQNPSLLETISSVPLAITKLSYELFTKGTLRYDLAKAKDFTFNHAPFQNKLGSIQFPIRFGDVNQYNDGLIGYWHGLNPTDTFFINSETVRTFTDEVKIINALTNLKGIELLKEEIGKNLTILKLSIDSIPRLKSQYSEKIDQLNSLINLKTIKLFSTDFKFLKDKSVNEVIHSFIGLINELKKDKLLRLNLDNLSNFINSDPSFKEYLSRVLPHLNEISEISIDKLETSIFNKSTLQDLTLENVNFNDVYSDKIESVIDLIKDLKQDYKIENAFEFLIEILNKKGHISKADVLKHFVEYGNQVWKMLQDIELIHVNKTELSTAFELNGELVKVTAVASKKLDTNNHVLLNDKPQFIYALIHPKAKIFFKTGILPEKHIILPYNEIKNPLRKIELTLLTSPVLTPKDDLQISLLQDSRYKWSWIELEKSNKKQALAIANKPIKHRMPQDVAVNLTIEIDGELSFDKENYDTLSKYIDLDEGDFFPGEHIYYLNRSKYNDLLQNLEKEVVLENQNDSTKVSKEQRKIDLECLEIINQKKISNINSFNTSSAVIPQLVLKEGWLALKPTKI